MDLPPDFVFETEAHNKHNPPTHETSESDEHSSSDDPDDAARTEKNNDVRTPKRKVVTFANTEYLKQVGDDDDDDEEEEETEEQRYMRMRLKRSASLPSIEVNRELARKIRRMLRAEEQDPEEALNRQLSEGLRLTSSLEVEKATSEIKYEYEFSHGQVLQVRLGDITEEVVDIIVNEANSNLTHNGGVAAVIAQKGGRVVQHLSDRWYKKHGPVAPGQVAVTEAGQLHCSWIIHAVGPIWRGGSSGEDAELFDAMWNSLMWASKLQARSIAIPLIGAGFLGFQKERCSYLLVDCVSKFFRKHPKSSVQEIRVVNHNDILSDSVVFEMVGKFTGGCETSESEREFVSDGDDDEFDEDEEEEEDDIEDDEGEFVNNGNGADTVRPSRFTRNPSIIKSPKSQIKEHVASNWMPIWRRQSIA